MQYNNKGLQLQMIKSGAIQIAFEQLYKKSFDRETANHFYTEKDFINLAKSQQEYQPFQEKIRELGIDKNIINEHENILKINSILEDSDIRSLLKFRTESVNSEGNAEVAEEEKEEIKESDFGLSRKSRIRDKRKTEDTEEEEEEENKEGVFGKRRSPRIKDKRSTKRRNEIYSPTKRRSKKDESNNKTKKMNKKSNSKAQSKLDMSNKNKLGTTGLLANNELLENMFEVHPINFDHSFHWNPTDTFIPFRMNGSGFI